jgi:hypothetical protein
LTDQVDNLNLLQHQISFREGKPGRERLGNKAVDVPVNAIPAARSDMSPYNLQSGIFCHVTTSCPENVVQDHGEVYDVAHHASNILLADMQETETERRVGDTSRYSLTCLDKYLFIVQYTYLDDVPPGGMAGSLMTWVIFILNWLLDRY